MIPSLLAPVRNIPGLRKIRRISIERILGRRTIKIHLGCGNEDIPDFLNVDVRSTPATDLVLDCSTLDGIPQGVAKVVFCNAFVEHLYRKQLPVFLRELKRVLSADGYAVLLGIPDFETVARSYIQGERGFISERFDLYEVYRYTHGDPESQPSWWLEQLHKNLFDHWSLSQQLADAGFVKYSVFRYYFPGEHLPV